MRTSVAHRKTTGSSLGGEHLILLCVFSTKGELHGRCLPALRQQPVRLPDPSLCVCVQLFCGEPDAAVCNCFNLDWRAAAQKWDALEHRSRKERISHKSFRVVVSPVGTFLYNIELFQGPSLWWIKILKANSAATWLAGLSIRVGSALRVRVLKRNGNDLAHYALRMVLSRHMSAALVTRIVLVQPHSARTILLQLQLLCALSAPSYHAHAFHFSFRFSCTFWRKQTYWGNLWIFRSSKYNGQIFTQIKALRMKWLMIFATRGDCARLFYQAEHYKILCTFKYK